MNRHSSDDSTRDVLPRHNPVTNPNTNPLQEKKPANPRMTTTATVTTQRGPRWARWVSMKVKNHFVAAVGEFVGTTLFLFFAFGAAQIANIPSVSITQDTVTNTSQLLFISLGFGFSLCVCAWVFFRVSGGLFNPAVSLGLALVGAITPVRAAILVFAQLLGGMTGAAIIQVLLPGPLYVNTTLSGGISVAQGLFLEMFLTALLMLTILLLAAEKHKATYLAPVGIGLSLFIAEMTGVYWTGGSLNPARSFGPAVVSKRFPTYHWIYWLGPCLGATLAAGFYKFIKVLQYEDVNPDQDGETQPASQFQTRSSKLAEKIKRAEQVTRDTAAAHRQALQRNTASYQSIPQHMAPPAHMTGSYGQMPSQSEALAVQEAKFVELSLKLDAILSAVSHQAIVTEAVANATVDAPAPVAPHDAPFTVLA